MTVDRRHEGGAATDVRALRATGRRTD